MTKVMRVEEAIRLIQDGDTITWSGTSGVLNPETMLRALEAPPMPLPGLAVRQGN